MAYPTKVDELPSQPFFAVLVPTAVYIPGDERSRTFPGHGYPESTEYHWHIITFENEEKWKEDISRRMQHDGEVFKSGYRICSVTETTAATWRVVPQNN